MTLPPWAEIAHPAPRVAPKLRLVVELGEGDVAYGRHTALRLVARAALALAKPGGATHAALTALLAARPEEVR